jgi:hypothetical protein
VTWTLVLPEEQAILVSLNETIGLVQSFWFQLCFPHMINIYVSIVKYPIITHLRPLI